jgi:hypothetical protein
MNYTSQRVERRAVPLLLVTLLALSACEGAQDAPEGAHDEPSSGAAPVASSDATLLASVRLSKTHVVEFYEMSPGNGMVSEDFDFDHDHSALDGLVLRDGELLPAYRQLAGMRATPAELSRIEAYEARRKALVPVAVAGEIGAEASALPAQASAVSGPVNKDRASDAYWFSATVCSYPSAPNGCLGHDGARYSWLPTDLPVCTNTVEMCGTGFADPVRDKGRWSHNMLWAVYNQASSGADVTGRYILVDPCENDRGILPRLCKKGSLGYEFTVTPRHARQTTTTSTLFWTRQVEATGNHPIGLMVNAFD